MGEPATRRIECPCGARLRVPDDGRPHKARCPKCRTITNVAGEAALSHETAPSPARPHTDGDGDYIRVRCDCGKKIGVPSHAAGKRAKCPKCGAAVPIPAIELDDEPDDDILSFAPEPSRDDGALKFKEGPSTVVAPGDAPLGDTFAAPPPPERTEAEPRVCPSCKQALPAEAVICTDCGVNLKTGRSLITTQDENLDSVYMYVQGILWWLSWPLWVGWFPIASEAFGLRKPWVTRGIAILTVAVSIWFWFAVAANPEYESLMLWSGGEAAFSESEYQELLDEGLTSDEIEELLSELEARPYQSYQLFTHALLHADVGHLISNLIFLIVFGSRVNTLIGNVLTAMLYPALAVAAALAQLASQADEFPSAMLGASGAVMGLAGMYIVIFPVHNVHMVAWLRLWFLGMFRLNLSMFAVRGFWVVLFYIAFDVLYTSLGVDSGTAHWAHLGGFITGVVFALVLLIARLADARGGDILTITLGRLAWPIVGPPNRRGWTLW